MEILHTSIITSNIDPVQCSITILFFAGSEIKLSESLSCLTHTSISLRLSLLFLVFPFHPNGSKQATACIQFSLHCWWISWWFTPTCLQIWFCAIKKMPTEYPVLLSPNVNSHHTVHLIFHNFKQLYPAVVPVHHIIQWPFQSLSSVQLLITTISQSGF